MNHVVIGGETTSLALTPTTPGSMGDRDNAESKSLERGRT